MDEKVIKLIDALDRAYACRAESAIDAICHRCWADVELALDAVRNVYKPEPLTKIPVD